MKSENVDKFLRMYSKLLLILVVMSWLISYLGNGMMKVYSWISVIVVLPIIGFSSLIIIIVLLLRLRKYSKKYVRFLVLCVLLIVPFGGVLGVYPLEYPVDTSRTPLVIPSPFIEEVYYVPLDENRAHKLWPQERLAYDVLAAPYDHGAKMNAEYGIWEMPVYSPVVGEVVGVCSDQVDIMPLKEEFTSLAGNYVYIKVTETNSYLIFAHLKEDSIPVNVGDKVEPGQLLGKIGNSGTTSEPHLHLQHQRQNPNEISHPLLAEGLPLIIEGKVDVKNKLYE